MEEAPPSNIVLPSGLILDRDNITLEVGTAALLSALVKSDNATDRTVIWSSSNPSVAVVDNGKVTGVSKGTVTISAATVNGKVAVCAVNVTAAEEPALDFDDLHRQERS